MLSRLRQLWRAAGASAYRRGMARPRPTPRLVPVPREKALSAHPGEWVAVKEGRVIAHHSSSREVVRMLRAQGRAAEGAVLHRSAQPTEAIAVGLG